MAEISVGEQLRQDGQAIKSMSATFQDILTRAYQLVNSIDQGWEGLSNAAFMSDYQRIRTSLEKLPEAVQGLGNGAISAADAYEQTDVSGAKR